MPVCTTAFSVPTFKASCSPEPIFASLSPPPPPDMLPKPFRTLSNCAEAGEAVAASNATTRITLDIDTPKILVKKNAN